MDRFRSWTSCAWKEWLRSQRAALRLHSGSHVHTYAPLRWHRPSGRLARWTPRSLVSRAATQLLVCCWVLLVFAASSDAAAPAMQCSKVDVCRTQLKVAADLYQNKDYPQALLIFQSIYDRWPEPRLLLNIGRTLHKLGHVKDALIYYRRCQAELQMDPTMQTSLQKYIQEAQDQLAAPAPARTEPAQPQTQPQPGPTEPPPAASDPEPQPEPPPAPLVVSAPPARTPAPVVLPTSSELQTKRPIYKKWWFWTAIGVGAAGVAGAVTAIVVSQRSAATADTPALPAGIIVYQPIY